MQLLVTQTWDWGHWKAYMLSKCYANKSTVLFLFYNKQTKNAALFVETRKVQLQT